MNEPSSFGPEMNISAVLDRASVYPPSSSPHDQASFSGDLMEFHATVYSETDWPTVPGCNARGQISGRFPGVNLCLFPVPSCVCPSFYAQVPMLQRRLAIAPFYQVPDEPTPESWLRTWGPRATAGSSQVSWLAQLLPVGCVSKARPIRVGRLFQIYMSWDSPS